MTGKKKVKPRKRQMWNWKYLVPLYADRRVWVKEVKVQTHAHTHAHKGTWQDWGWEICHTRRREREQGEQRETEEYESQSWCKALLHSLKMPPLLVSNNKQNPKPNLGIYIKTVGAGGFPLNDTQEIPNMKTLNSDILKHWFLCFGGWRFDT